MASVASQPSGNPVQNLHAHYVAAILVPSACLPRLLSVDFDLGTIQERWKGGKDEF